MSTPTSCPVCSSFGEAVMLAFGRNEKCPTCGLPADAAWRIVQAQQNHADKELWEKYARSVEENEKLRRENSAMKDALGEIKGQLDCLAQWYDIKL